MKFAVRAFVVALVLTGAAASTQTTTSASAKANVIAPKTAGMPIPVCPPKDPNACGF
jgi:hypothetical protein